MSTWVLTLFLTSALQLATQEEPFAVDLAIKRLHEIDDRIYRPPETAALSFSFRPGSEQDGQAPYRVFYQWRKGLGDRVDLLSDDGTILEAPPQATTDEQRSVMNAHLLATARQLGEMLRGRTWIEEYADFRGSVVSERVNGELEERLVLEPRNPKKLRRVVVRLARDGMPWRSEKEYIDRHNVEINHTFDQRGEKRILTKVQHVHTPANPAESAMSFAYLFTYQKVQGEMYLATVTKTSREQPKGALGTTEFLDLKVNDQVLPFEPKR